MTDMSLPASTFAAHEFRVGDAMNKAMTVLSHNLLPFSIVTGVAALPQVLFFRRQADQIVKPEDLIWLFAGIGLSIVLNSLSQATVLYGAFEDMRGGGVDMMASFRQAWRRFLPVIGATICAAFFAMLSGITIVVPFILMTMWYVATPACVVEQTGPWTSLRRSAALTKGYRWKVFGMMIVLALIGGVGSGMAQAVQAGSGATIAMVFTLIWTAFYGAYSAILVVVIYHDLRVAKEGVDTDQIAAVFE